MKIEESCPTIQGIPLHRLVLSPEQGQESGRHLIFFHGQGDFIDRYPPILKPFVDAGISCILTDLPGHGQSPGRRGEVPGMNFIDEVLQDSMRDREGEFLVAGHSMGGLLALRFYLNSPDDFVAAWFSAPLLEPMHQAKPWMKKLLPILAPLLPWLTVDTGVRTADCTIEGDTRMDCEVDGKPLYHSRISLGWGRQLRDAAELVREQFPLLQNTTPTLFTQGSDDHVCPPEIIRRRLGRLNSDHFQYHEINGARHEPFTGPTAAEVDSALRSWIKDHLRSDSEV